MRFDKSLINPIDRPIGYRPRHVFINVLQHISSVECNIHDQTTSRGGTVWIGTYDNKTVAVSEYCPLHYCKTETVELSLHDTEINSTQSQCNYRHDGILCGGCQHGLSLVLGSEKCSNAYIFLVLPFALVGIAVVFFIKLSNFTICQGTVNGFIFYANVINANKHLYYDQTINPVTIFIAWFNLDLGIETCFYDGLTAYVKTWLQFVFPIYIWCLAGGIVFLAKYSRGVAKILGNNGPGVPVLATLFLLSYAKIFTTTIKAVSYTTLHTMSGELVWSVDGNIDYLGPKHAPLFAAAIAALLLLWLPYTLLLLFGKYLHKVNWRLLTCILLKLKPFLDANYALLHDRHQYWFGMILIVKAVVLLSSAVSPANGAHVMLLYSLLPCLR